jgi:hypothetical protein
MGSRQHSRHDGAVEPHFLTRVQKSVRLSSLQQAHSIPGLCCEQLWQEPQPWKIFLFQETSYLLSQISLHMSVESRSQTRMHIADLSNLSSGLDLPAAAEGTGSLSPDEAIIKF